MVYVWFEVSFNFKNFAQRSSEVNSLVRFELCQHVDRNLLSKNAFARINTWMRFSNYAIQSQQIQVTFTFKKQNVRQTTYRNNSSNRWRTNPERYPESKCKQHWNSLQKTTQVSTLTIVLHDSITTNSRCIRLKKQNGRQKEALYAAHIMLFYIETFSWVL